MSRGDTVLAAVAFLRVCWGRSSGNLRRVDLGHSSSWLSELEAPTISFLGRREGSGNAGWAQKVIELPTCYPHLTSSFLWMCYRLQALASLSKLIF